MPKLFFKPFFIVFEGDLFKSTRDIFLSLSLSAFLNRVYSISAFSELVTLSSVTTEDCSVASPFLKFCFRFCIWVCFFFFVVLCGVVFIFLYFLLPTPCLLPGFSPIGLPCSSLCPSTGYGAHHVVGTPSVFVELRTLLTVASVRVSTFCSSSPPLLICCFYSMWSENL